jgi:hypothetical protein
MLHGARPFPFVLHTCARRGAHVEVEKRAALAARFGHDEVVERQVVRDDQILLDVHHRVVAGRAQLAEPRVYQLLARLLEELPDRRALCDWHADVCVCDGCVAAMYLRHDYRPAMAAAVPV